MTQYLTNADNGYRVATGPFEKVGFIDIPLSGLREVASNAIPNIAGIGGFLASDTTQILNLLNETDQIAAAITTETMITSSTRRNKKRRGFFLVKGARSAIIRPGAI